MSTTGAEPTDPRPTDPAAGPAVQVQGQGQEGPGAGGTAGRQAEAAGQAAKDDAARQQLVMQLSAAIPEIVKASRPTPQVMAALHGHFTPGRLPVNPSAEHVMALGPVPDAILIGILQQYVPQIADYLITRGRDAFDAFLRAHGVIPGGAGGPGTGTGTGTAAG